MVLARTWLVSKATRPLLVAPGLGRWALFVGYKRRLRRLAAVNRASKDYFGLPADSPDGDPILPDVGAESLQTGSHLHTLIANAAGPQRPVLVVGTGGAGKSTLLARLAFLALGNHGPEAIRGYMPVLVPANFYTTDLVSAISDTLRERDGVAVTTEIIKAQLQSSKLLILFDGLSDIATEKRAAMVLDVLRSAQNADYGAARFVFATRPIEGLPADVRVFQLKPLTVEAINQLIPRYGTSAVREAQVRRQLEFFGSRPLEPLLFSMVLMQSASDTLSLTLADLYENYMRRLLRAETERSLWYGWRAGLERLAEWFLLDTGYHGIGLPHVALVNRLTGEPGLGQASEDLIRLLQRHYRFPIKDPLELLERAEAAGVLVGGRRWRFAHDTFEEYFAACRLMSVFEEQGRWPELGKWRGNREREQDFVAVLRFVREMGGETTLAAIRALPLPATWKGALE